MAWIETIGRDTKINSDKIERIYFQTSRAKLFEGHKLFEQDLEEGGNTPECVQEIQTIRLDIRVSCRDADCIIFSVDISSKCSEYAMYKSGKSFRQKDEGENDYHYGKHRRSFIVYHSYPIRLVLGNTLISEIISAISTAKNEDVLNFFKSFKEKDIGLCKSFQTLEEEFDNLETDPEWERERIKFLKKKNWL